MEINFNYNFGEPVKIIRSNERGKVVAVSKNFRMKEAQYYIEYTTVNGAAEERWFNESEITSAD